MTRSVSQSPVTCVDQDGVVHRVWFDGSPGTKGSLLCPANFYWRHQIHLGYGWDGLVVTHADGRQLTCLGCIANESLADDRFGT